MKKALGRAYKQQDKSFASQRQTTERATNTAVTLFRTADVWECLILSTREPTLRESTTVFFPPCPKQSAR